MPDTDPPDAKPPKSLPIGPDHYRTGPGARHALGATAARFGGRAYLVHGEVGFPRIADDLRASLRASGVETVERKHVGPATAHAASVHAGAAREAGADVVVSVGGGRVMDVGKSAAGAAGLPCITVPTSPATCAGATVAVVEYDAAGVYLASPLRAELWLVTIVDTEVLAAAPDRLLAAGIADALAKIVEVRYVTGRSGGGRDGRSRRRGRSRRAVAGPDRRARGRGRQDRGGARGPQRADPPARQQGRHPRRAGGVRHSGPAGPGGGSGRDASGDGRDAGVPRLPGGFGRARLRRRPRGRGRRRLRADRERGGDAGRLHRCLGGGAAACVERGGRGRVGGGRGPGGRTGRHDRTSEAKGIAHEDRRPRTRP